MSVALNKRPEELSLKEVIDRYPEVPPLVILKIDVQRRGVHYTERALQVVNPTRHQLRGPALFGYRDGHLSPLPESLMLRDGTSIIVDPIPVEQNPYLVDYLGGRTVLVDRGEVLEEVEYWPKPAYYDKKTSSGIPMSYVFNVRPQRLNFFQPGFCHFWRDNNGCLFCDIFNNYKQQRKELGIPTKLNPLEISETIHEALQEPGAFTTICLTAGSRTGGGEPFDEEVDYYIEVLQAIGENFRTKKFPSQLIATAFNEKQLQRLYEETGLMSYTADLEVLNRELFEWICPGKTKWIGYQGWKERLFRAVDIFGCGHVGTGIVGGVELAKPLGFTNEDEALESTLAEAEDLARHGVTTVYIVWYPRPGSKFHDQQNASLDYYVRLAEGLHNLRVKYRLPVDFDDFRRCGNHPDTDLSRML
jgi:hypothetical protein